MKQALEGVKVLDFYSTGDATRGIAVSTTAKINNKVEKFNIWCADENSGSEE